MLTDGKVSRVGLVATNSIRSGVNRLVLDEICEKTRIFEAWDDEDWEGSAGVRVSIVCFDSNRNNRICRLNGFEVSKINADLSSGSVGQNLTKVKRLKEMSGLSFMGVTKSGPFEIEGKLARQFINAVGNPNGRSNSDVLKRSVNGNEVSGRITDRWIIDFGDRTEKEISEYEVPYQYALSTIRPVRINSGTIKNRKYWWKFERYRPEMKQALSRLSRYIATPLVSKHRIFVWLHVGYLPENGVIAIARDDNVTFGILHSKIHSVWTQFLGSTHFETRRYTPTTTFETFPFPTGLTPNLDPKSFVNDPRAISINDAVVNLCEKRFNWLYSRDLTVIQSEVIDGFPERILPKMRSVQQILNQRTLNNLYKSYPMWLELCHEDLDLAVATAYGWEKDFVNGKLSDEEVFQRLFELSKSRA